MTRKKTTSDALKLAFNRMGLGHPKNWKRINKKQDATGAIVRVFEHRKNMHRLEVMETAAGVFKARPLPMQPAAIVVTNDDDTLTDSAVQNAYSRAAMTATDAQLESAADSIIEKLLNGDEEDIKPVELNTAGTALAARFCFAIAIYDDTKMRTTDSGLTVSFSPVGADGFDQSTYVIDPLLPAEHGRMRAELLEGTYSFNDYDAAGTLAAALCAIGFRWDKDWQKTLDDEARHINQKELGGEIAAALSAVEKQAAAPVRKNLKP